MKTLRSSSIAFAPSQAQKKPVARAIKKAWDYMQFPLMVGGLVIAIGISSAFFSKLYSQENKKKGAKTEQTSQQAPQNAADRGKSAENRLPLEQTTDSDTAAVRMLSQRDPSLKFFYTVKMTIPSDPKALVYIEPDILLGSMDQVPLYAGRLKKVYSKWFVYGEGRLVVGSPEPLTKGAQ